MRISRLIMSFILIIAVIAGCKSQKMANIDRGSDVTFRQGYPEMRILAVGLFDNDDLPGIDLTVDIVKGSLVYKIEDSVYRATVELGIQILQDVNGEQVSIQNRIQELEITGEDRRIVDSGEVFTFNERIPLLPGDYEILVSLIDKASGNQTVR